LTILYNVSSTLDHVPELSEDVCIRKYDILFLFRFPVVGERFR
jgi:hypothetical protein